MLLAVADQVGTAHGLERLAQQRPVVRVVIAQESLVQAAPALALHHVHHFRAIGIRAIRAVHALSGFMREWYIAVAVAMGLG